jgi:2-hydroxychromene-2-carboxylate isomerase
MQADVRKAYRAVDQARIAKAHGIPINLKPAFWPAPQELASGMIIAVQEDGDDPMALAQAIMAAVWVEDKNIADEKTLEKLAQSCGFGGGDLLARAKSDAVQAIFDANTSEASEKGVFGSPSFIVEGELFWGQDRLDYVEAAL